MLDRRALLALTASAAALPFSVRAQQAGRLPVVGFVLGASPVGDMAGPDPASPVTRAFVHGLRDLGWVEGKTVAIERRSVESEPARAPGIFADLVARGADVIVYTWARWSYDAANKATKTIPTVVNFGTDPVADGLIASLARPGGNLTGLTSDTGPEFMAKRLQLLKEMAPGVSRVAFLGQREYMDSYLTHSGAERPHFFAAVENPRQFDEAFAAVMRERVDALNTFTGNITYAYRGRIVAFAAEQRLPAAYPFAEAARDGGLMSYGSSQVNNFRQMAGIVDKILKGAKPADIPVERPTKFELVINLKTAAAMGVAVPQLLLARADEIIE
jgi:putative tryptophan/tyrosine transport system substrate-binding protein